MNPRMLFVKSDRQFPGPSASRIAEGLLCEPINPIPVQIKLQIKSLFCEPIGHKRMNSIRRLDYIYQLIIQAGEDKGYKNGYIAGYNIAKQETIDAIPNALVTGCKAGIKEVVEWLSIYHTDSPFCGFSIYLTEEEWQAKLKEWGIE